MTTQFQTLDQPFHTLSDKYKLVKTSELIPQIEGMGFTLEKFVANKVRNKEKQGFQKHRAIFNSPNLKSQHNDGHVQLLLTNSHDGTSGVIFQLGFFRLVCANGLVLGSSVGSPISLRHSGNDLYNKLNAAILDVTNQVSKLDASIDRMKSRAMSTADTMQFIQEALKIRFNDAEIVSANLPVRRFEDNNTDLFTVFNVVQESMIRGGGSVILNRDGKTVNQTIRRINSINSQTKVNTKLWDLADSFAA